MNTAELYDLFLRSQGVTTDTRNLVPNSLFFALKGDQFDGNQFAMNALEKGAIAAVVSDKSLKDKPGMIWVEDTLKCLQELARFHRTKLNTPLVALTGSNGKTTTKELIATVLSKKFRVIATKGNLNNHIGVPLTLLQLTPDTQIGVIEMGANHQKEIAGLCEIAQPDFGCITNYGKAHLEGFGGVEGVIKGKSEMYDHLKAHHKHIFYNAEDPIQKEKVGQYQPASSWSSHKEGALNATLTQSLPFVSGTLNGTPFESQLIGAYNFNNICLAALIGLHFGLDTVTIAEAIAAYTPQNNRSQLMTRGRYQIILDAYNANPSSMKVALENFQKLADKEKLAILGDMFELGEEAAAEHQQIARLALDLGIEEAWLVGENFYKVESPYLKFRTFEDLKAHLQTRKPEAGRLLIKGSRGMALERVLEFL